MKTPLVLTQDRRHFNDPETGYILQARTIQPCESYGGWPGVQVTIREWTLHNPNSGKTSYRPCSDEEILHYEAMLGEWNSVRITTHPTLGRVSSQNHRKPTRKTFHLLDWGECTQYINETHGIDTRDFANSHAQYDEWCAANHLVPDSSSQTQYAQYQADITAGKLVERPYQDFWHWLLDVADIHRGGMLELDEEMGEDAEPWQKQILSLYLTEFGKGPYHTNW